MNVVKLLDKLDACDSAMDWVRDRLESYSLSLSEMWQQCPDSDWMMWLLGSLVEHRRANSISYARKVTACAMEIALLYKKDWPAKHADQLSVFVDVVLKWCQDPALAYEGTVLPARKHLRQLADGVFRAYCRSDDEDDDSGYKSMLSLHMAASVSSSIRLCLVHMDQESIRLQLEIIKRHFPEPPDLVAIGLGHLIEEEP